MPVPAAPMTDLPVEAVIADLRHALRAVGAAVLQAAPGAGKSTVVPLRLLDEPWWSDGDRLVVLEPRRLAARAVARRMASLLGEPVGATVGFRTRDERVVSAGTRIEVVTEGILTRRLQRDPSLPGTAMVVFDEVHERNLDGDLALALTLDVRAALRPDLRVLAMSATLDIARLTALLGDAPVVAAPGRMHPVDIRWVPVAPTTGGARRSRGPGQHDAARNLSVAVAAAVRRALTEQPGDVLVFLPGAAEIRATAAALTGLPDGVDVRPLFGALSTTEQDAALAPSAPGRRRVVLATDIAETSLTVPGVRTVVDAGRARRPRYDPRTGLSRLQTVACSQASADQRAGRAGRTAPGAAYRLWSATDHATRAAFTPPEIAEADLAGLVLQLAIWGADDPPFLDPPPAPARAQARVLLHALGALDRDGRPTTQGRAMAELPLHPRLGAMVVEGNHPVACALAALLGERDVLAGRPDERSVDLTDRVRLVLPGGSPCEVSAPVDRAALATVRTRYAELARRVSGSGRSAAGTGGVTGERVGRLLASAYPDRVAQARGRGRFRLRAGPGVAVPVGSALAGERFVIVAEVTPGEPDGRIRLAAPLDSGDVVELFGSEIETVRTVAWDPTRDDLRARTERRLGALVLSATQGPAPAGPATIAALVERVRVTGLDALAWSDATRGLQVRAVFARRARPGDGWADLSDEALAAELDDWLAPLLHGATGRAALDRVDLLLALRTRLGHHRRRELDALVPPTLTVGRGDGRAVPVDYSGDAPLIATRAQDLYGTTVHPTIAGVPVVVELLSPARRPIQRTADLPGFWAGSWREVRKDMAGRYPKHDWPVDPRHA